MAKVLVLCCVILIAALVPFVVSAEGLNIADFFLPPSPGTVLHYESDDPDDPKGAHKVRHAIHILETRTSPESGDVTVKTEEEFIGMGAQFTERFEYILSNRQSEIRRIAKDENRTILKGPLIVGTSWPVSYEIQADAKGKPTTSKKLKATCSIADIKTEKRLNKSTTCLRVACPVLSDRASFTDNFCFCEGFGYFGTLVEEPSGKKVWQEKLTSIEHGKH